MSPHNKPFRVVLLSGPVCSGKSVLTRKLEEVYEVTIIKTKEFILERKPRTKPQRRAMQLAGQRLDNEDGGAWVCEGLQRKIDELTTEKTPTGLFVVDSVRILGQIDAIRQAFGSEVVFHVHLKASPETLQKRFEERERDEDSGMDYLTLTRNRTEKKIGELAKVADIVVDTDKCSEGAVLVRATALLNLYPRSNDALVDVLIGGQYGSEGKGNIVGHIAPEYNLLVRVGGPNAGHQVYAEPKPEKYYHLPSGTNRAPNARLLLGPGAVINPEILLKEIANHKIPQERLIIDGQAVIIGREDVEEEKERFKIIGSTAQGVGIASARKITGRGDYKSEKTKFLAKDCKDLKPFIGNAKKIISDAIVSGQRILLEGTQGTSLSLHHGEYPHVTSRDTTVAGCLADAGIAPSHLRKVILVFRTYPIRVAGPSGPMQYEVSLKDISTRSGIALNELKQTEKTTTTNRPRRIAEFDWEQFRDSVQLNGPTDIALTFVDYLGQKNSSVYRFEQLNEETIRFVEELERVSGRPVSLLSTGFNHRNIIDRRTW